MLFQGVELADQKLKFIYYFTIFCSCFTSYYFAIISRTGRYSILLFFIFYPFAISQYAFFLSIYTFFSVLLFCSLFSLCSFFSICSFFTFYLFFFTFLFQSFFSTNTRFATHVYYSDRSGHRSWSGLTHGATSGKLSTIWRCVLCILYSGTRKPICHFFSFIT